MTIEEIRKNKPDGANGYWDYPATGLDIDYYKNEANNIYVWRSDKSIWSLCNEMKKYKIKPL